MTATLAMAQNGKATTEKKTFSRETAVSTTIKADPAIIWKLLTNAADFPRWNSTVISIDGNDLEIQVKQNAICSFISKAPCVDVDLMCIDGRIAEGEKIKLKSTLDPKRTFKLKVKKMETNKLLEWGDGQGHRVYAITNNGDGTVLFSMNEKIGGFMFPMYAKHIPPFDKSFEQFAADLKKEAEMIQNFKK